MALTMVLEATPPSSSLSRAQTTPHKRKRRQEGVEGNPTRSLLTRRHVELEKLSACLGKPNPAKRPLNAAPLRNSIDRLRRVETELDALEDRAAAGDVGEVVLRMEAAECSRDMILPQAFYRRRRRTKIDRNGVEVRVWQLTWSSVRPLQAAYEIVIASAISDEVWRQLLERKAARQKQEAIPPPLVYAFGCGHEVAETVAGVAGRLAQKAKERLVPLLRQAYAWYHR